jgi:hypothetical protein
MIGCATADASFGLKHNHYRMKSIAVIDISELKENKIKTIIVAGHIVGAVGERCAELLESALMKLGIYDIKERNYLNKILDEQQLQLSDLVDLDTAVNVGRIAGLDGIVIMNTYASTLWVFPILYSSLDSHAKLIDVETGDIVWSVPAKYRMGTVIPLIAFWLNPKEMLATAIAEEIEKNPPAPLPPREPLYDLIK